MQPEEKREGKERKKRKKSILVQNQIEPSYTRHPKKNRASRQIK
jgi:hypothetical protein